MNSLKKRSSRRRAEQEKRTYLGVGFIFLILFLVLVSFLYQRAVPSVWDGSSMIGVVGLEKEELDLRVLLPKQEKIVSFKVPLNTVAKAPFGFGEYQLGSVYKLGKLENEEGRVLMQTVQNNFSIPVSGFRAMGRSNLTWWDVVRIFWYEKMVVSRSKVLDLKDEQVLQEDYLADGTLVFRIKELFLDELVNEELFDEEFLAEELEVAIFNASNEAGVALNVSRLVRNLGGDVTVVSNLDLIESSAIRVSKEEYKKSYTALFLASIFGVEEVELMKEDEFRADVAIVIGKDYLSLK